MPWKLSDGDFCHVEIPANDLARSQKFYGDVFGWEFIDIPGWEDGKLIKTSEDGIEGSLGTLAPNDKIVAFIMVKGTIDDMRRKADEVEAAGGSVVHPPTALPENMGAFAYLADPEGQVFGLWQD
ncbi:MAG TPA: VOC family protein [Actinomycetota bacterium]|nr:VOC family protein [Actinomycetota bacterium]